MTPRPYTLVAELTYRCPLRCPYCSNPVTQERGAELDTASWRGVFEGAAELGVLQAHLTGGEPLARDDLEALVADAHAAGLYTNLITSGVPLDRARLDELKRAGLDHVQLSIQAPDAEASDAIAGFASHAHKLEVAAWVKALGLPLTLNCVLHAANIAKVAEIVALAEELSADRLELANVQLLGWALENRAALLCDKPAIDAAFEAARAARERLRGKMEIVFVLPDYVADRPRACMDGWARRYVVVDPQGFVLPCHAARSIPLLAFERVGARSLAEIWTDSPALLRFRGDDWMPEPCRSCDKKAVDFGGCRCQAFALTGDAARTDPACSLSSDHHLVAKARVVATQDAPRRYVFRGFPKPAARGSRPGDDVVQRIAMYRAHGAPEVQREDVAVDVLCARIGRLKRRLRFAVVATSLAAASGAVYVSVSGPVQLTPRLVGLAFATALLGTLFGTHEVATRVTLALAERWARRLASERRCDVEPLLDAARLLSGGGR